jgi:hypothetical protein
VGVIISISSLEGDGSDSGHHVYQQSRREYAQYIAHLS